MTNSLNLAGGKVVELRTKIKAIEYRLYLVNEAKPIQLYYIARKKPSKSGHVKWYSEEKPYKPWVTDIGEAMPLKVEQLQNFKVGQVYFPAEYIDGFNTSLRNCVKQHILDMTKANTVKPF